MGIQPGKSLREQRSTLNALKGKMPVRTVPENANEKDKQVLFYGQSGEVIGELQRFGFWFHQPVP